jgi:hypothetical protein
MVYMALDFPATPTDGQEYDNFIYSATKGAWTSKPNLPVKTAVGPVAPSNANEGDQWLDSNTGTLYVYYTDADSSQWVEILAKSSVSSALYGRVGVLETEMDTVQTEKWQSYNYIINSGFDIWQRGTSITVDSTTAYTADRWKAGRPTNASGIVVSKAGGLLGGVNSLKLQRVAGNTLANDIRLSHNFETAGQELQGKTVTISFSARTGNDYSGGSLSLHIFTSSVDPGSVVYSTGGFFNSGNADLTESSTTFTLSNSSQRYTFTTQIANTANAMQIVFSRGASGTAGADDTVYIADVQLEQGTTATPFRRNQPNIQAELAACQRYYYRISADAVAERFGLGQTTSTTVAVALIHFPVTMRTKITEIEQSGTASDYSINNASGTVVSLSSVPTYNSGSRINCLINLSSTFTAAGQATTFRAQTTNAYLGFSAEL